MAGSLELGLDFDRLSRLTVIKGAALNTAPIRIGGGREEALAAADMPVLRDAEGRPYIPGSSIKGALRSLAEAIARASGFEVCNIFDKENPCVEALKRYKEECRESPEQCGDSIERPCVVCRVFGNQELASHIVVHDALPKNKGVRVLQRTRVGIDRFRSAASQGALFTYEYIPRNYEWALRFEIYNIDIKGDSEEARLLRGLLKHFSTHGLPVGGMRSVGHGVLRLDPGKTLVKIFEIRDFTLKLTEERRIQEILG